MENHTVLLCKIADDNIHLFPGVPRMPTMARIYEIGKGKKYAFSISANVNNTPKFQIIKK